MLAKLYGIAKVDFVSAQGQRIQGHSIYVGYPAENVAGEKTEKFYVKDEVDFPEKLQIGDMINLSFNSKGKIESITRK